MKSTRIDPMSFVQLYMRGLSAYKYAQKRELVGIDFAQFGRKIGRQLLKRGVLSGASYLLVPVSSVRYFEFSFAQSCLPSSFQEGLDISSPRLFSLYVAQMKTKTSISICNPDSADIALTGKIASKLKINNISTHNWAVNSIANQGKSYDCIWSISVIEHISGQYDDADAIKFMYDSLNESGRLILTIPVDRQFWEEYRDENYYGMHSTQESGKHFFQRFYDKDAIEQRLLSHIKKEPTVVRWFGETSPGKFMEYITRWMHQGFECTVEDPREIANHYQEFPSWETMPGVGVCGILIEKD